MTLRYDGLDVPGAFGLDEGVEVSIGPLPQGRDASPREVLLSEPIGLDQEAADRLGIKCRQRCRRGSIARRQLWARPGEHHRCILDRHDIARKRVASLQQEPDGLLSCNGVGVPQELDDRSLRTADP